MKKLLLMAAVAVFGFTNVNAQDEAKTYGFAEGDIILEGNIAFGSTNNKNSDTKSSNFRITPKLGYFLSEDFAAGGTIGLQSSKSEVSGTDTSDESGFAVGVFGRYYFLELGERFKTYAELGISYENDKDKISDSAFNTIGAGVDLGINYFVKENIALTFGLRNVLSFATTKSDADGAEAVSGFNLGFGDVANPFGGNAAFGILFKF